MFLSRFSLANCAASGNLLGMFHRFGDRCVRAASGVVAVGLAALLAGCGSGSLGGDATTASPTPASASGEAASADPTPSPAEGSGETQAAPRKGWCTTRELDVTATDVQGAAGSTLFNVVLTNTSDTECTTQGFPVVSLVTDNNGTQLGKSAEREKDVEPAPVKLAPGASAVAPVRLTSVGPLDPQVCQPADADGIRVYPPEDKSSAFVPMKGLKGCAGEGLRYLSVQPVQLDR